MKLYELFESAGITPDNVDTSYTVSGIKIDNAGGMGSTPQGQNVEYQGFVAQIKISDFLKLATSADREEDANKFVQMLKDGKSIASPFLEVSSTDPDDLASGDLNFTIKNHEGRARIRAVQILKGDIMFPIQFILRGGLRAHHLNSKYFELLKSSKWKSQDGDLMKINIGNIYWKGKVL